MTRTRPNERVDTQALSARALRADVSNNIAYQLMRLAPEGRHLLHSIRYAAADKAIDMVDEHFATHPTENA